MLISVKDACELHPMALDYSMSEQIENLSDVIGAAAQSAHDFFDKNYISKGMETLLSQGLQRLGGRSDQAVFELKQAMGGGKSHSMIALGLLARDSGLRAQIEWIQNIESLDEYLSQFTQRKRRANALDLRYGRTVMPEGPGWELCEKVLSQRDIVERLSEGW
jgi:hypothetical protein